LLFTRFLVALAEPDLAGHDADIVGQGINQFVRLFLDVILKVAPPLALATAGLIGVFFAVAGRRLNIEEESDPTEATSIAPLTLDRDPQNRRPVWPPRTSPKIPD
jgi:hypothetical protein